MVMIDCEAFNSMALPPGDTIPRSIAGEAN